MDGEKKKVQNEMSVFLDRIEEEEDGSSTAILFFEEEEDEFREFVLPADFLPEGTNEGEYLTIKIFRDAEKTTEALDEARALLKKLEE